MVGKNIDLISGKNVYLIRGKNIDLIIIYTLISYKRSLIREDINNTKQLHFVSLFCYEGG